MKLQLGRIGIALALTFAMLIWAIPAYADDITDLENKTSDLEVQLTDINQDLLNISNEMTETEEKIESTNNELLRLEDSLAISRQNEERQYEDMKDRIKFMYENNMTSMLEILFEAENLSDFLNKADYIQSISEYDRDKLTQLQEVKSGIEDQETMLKEQKESLTNLQSQLKAQEAELNAKAEETSTDLAVFKKQLQALREEEARRQEAARKAAEEAAKQTASSNTGSSQSGNTTSSSTSGTTSTGSTSTGTVSSSSSGSSSSSSGNGSYNYGTSGGALTPEKGVVYYNGHRETYYSQKVLPGGGLNIPGRHVASDGTIRDGDGYICVASSDLPWGTLVETSLGMGKVYDTGCASGTIDIYTNW